MTDTADYGKRTGQRMRAVREQRGLALLQVEQASCGQFRRYALQAWESGTRQMRVEKLAKYADWLGVDILLLLPAEKDHDSLLQATAARAARNAVQDVTESFRSVSPEKARELVSEALGDLGGAA